MPQKGMQNLYAVLMAGGRGTRFWPASRHSRPKQLLSMLGGSPLVRQTFERLVPMVPPERILVVTGEDLGPAVRALLPEIPEANFLLEPEGRNTGPCIGWAALHLAKRDENAVMAVLPSDHLIAAPEKFRRILAAASDWARRGDHLVTLSIRPDRPETGYGYIEVGDPCGEADKIPVLRVLSFREKPDLATAERFLKAGTFFWNSGIFLWKASTLLDSLSQYLPEVLAGLQRMEEARGKSDAAAARKAFLDLPSISIDYGVLERARKVYTFLGEFGWNDVGSWASVYELSHKDASGNACGLETITLDSSGCLVEAPGRLVALIGVRDLVVVDSGDALLVCRRNECQRVREVVEALKKTGRDKWL